MSMRHMNVSLSTHEGIILSLADGWKCQRCWKYYSEVGLCEEYPDACFQCIQVLDPTLELDIHVLSAKRFDKFLMEEISKNVPLDKAVIIAGKRNNGSEPYGELHNKLY